MARLLIVDDNVEDREALARRLEHRGFDIVTAGDGQTGLELVHSEKPDLVLMDMSLPVLDGWQATVQIRELDADDQMPIIGLTSEAIPDCCAKALEAGCSDHHPKPIDFARLIEQIETLIINGTPADASTVTLENDDSE